MSEENKAIARRFLQVWGQGGVAVADELAAPNVSVFYPHLPEPIRGLADFKQLLQMYHSTFAEPEMILEEEIAEGDKVVVRWTVSAIHSGMMFGVAATGKEVTWTGITIYRIVDGKVVEERGEEHLLGALQQIGAVP